MKLHSSKPPVLLLLCLTGFPQISETIYSPALPNIANNLMTTNTLVQWTLRVYFIGFAIGVFTWGRLSDHIGRRKAMLIGLLVYVLGSFSCLVSHSITWLLLSRILQGFGASVGSVVVMTIMREAFDEHNQKRIFSMVGFVLAFSIALGPPIGGYLSEWFNWRANFVFLVLIGLVLTVLTFIRLPETLSKTIKQNKLKTLEVLRLFLKDKRLLGCIWLVGVTNGILFSYYAESPFIFIKIVGLTPSEYGYLSLFIATAALLGAFVSRRLFHIFDTDTIIAMGCVIMLISSLLLTVFSFSNLIGAQHVTASIFSIMIPMMGIIFGIFGLVIPATLSSALVKYKNVLGTAGALFGLSYYIVNAAITWGMGLIHNGTVMPMPIYFTVLCALVLGVFYISVKSTRVIKLKR